MKPSSIGLFVELAEAAPTTPSDADTTNTPAPNDKHQRQRPFLAVPPPRDASQLTDAKPA